MNCRSRDTLDRRALGALVAAFCGALAATSALAQVIPGEVVQADKARNLPFCEIVPVIGNPPIAQFYNTTGACPPAQFDAIDAKKLAQALHADMVFLNPRRHWMFDQIWVYKAGKTEDFDGVKATWMASMSPEVMKAGLKGPFTAMEIHRETKYLYEKGKPVFLMRTPDGKAYVMQSYTDHVEKSLSMDTLSSLGGKLTLPAGWKFEVKTLDRDLTIEPGKAGGVAHVIQDNLSNTYEGCGFDAACSYTP